MIQLISKKEYNSYKIKNTEIKEELENIEFEDLLKRENPENFETVMIYYPDNSLRYKATYIESIKSWIITLISVDKFLKTLLKFEEKRIFKIS